MCTFVFSVVSCEPGKFSAQTDRSRIVNGKGFSERIPVCQPCPPGTYAQKLEVIPASHVQSTTLHSLLVPPQSVIAFVSLTI